MSVLLTQISRSEKHRIAQALYASLSARLRRGPAEPALDDYLPQLQEVGARLAPPESDATRAQRIAAVVSADDDVDAYLRHIESYLAIEAMRRLGANAALAKALHDRAFPDGLAHIDDRIVEENAHCRASLAVLRSAEHAGTLRAIQFPMSWLDCWERAIDASDAAVSEVLRAASTQVVASSGVPSDPEVDWVEVVTRLRRYVTNRAHHDDVARIEEGRELLRPLFETLQRLRMGGAVHL